MNIELKKLVQIRDTLINEHGDFSRDDVEYEYDSFGELSQDSQYLFDERTERYANYEASIKSIEELIKEKKLYPITILDSVVGNIKEKLARAKIVLIKDILMENIRDLKKRTGISEKKLQRVLREAHEVSFR